MSGGECKVACSNEQYCIRTWNVRFMNQGKLDVVKQRMARVNIDILGISELKWTGMWEFNSDDDYIYYCGQESFRRNGAGLVLNKRVQNAALGCSLINSRMISVRFQGKPFNITVILVYAPNTTAKDAEVDQFYEDLQDLLYLTQKKKSRKRFPFHYKELECQRRKSRDIQNNRQVWPCSAKWSKAKTNKSFVKRTWWL